jgi:hypothetical protein
MKHAASTMTEQGAFLLFDPEGLPGAMDTWVENDQFDRIRVDLVDNRSAVLVELEDETDEDEPPEDFGARLHVYENEPMPRDLRPFCRDTRDIRDFTVISGTVWWTGVEYAFRHPDNRPTEDEGGFCVVDEGQYSIRFHRMEYEGNYKNERLKAEIDSNAYNLRELKEGLSCLGCLGAFAVLVLIFVPISWWNWFQWGVCPVLTAFLVANMLQMIPSVKDADLRWERILEECPDYVLEMTLLGE